jgi:orotidine-5'-phosphate decarboxylase
MNTLPSSDQIDSLMSQATKPLELRRASLLNEKARALYETMTAKKSNICFAADYTKMSELLDALQLVGPHVCMVKIHVDILADFTRESMQRVTQLAQELRFVLFEDRKLADIGRIAGVQLTGGIYKIADWADFVTVHSVIGEPSIGAMAELDIKTNAFLIADLTSDRNLIDANYTEKSIQIGVSQSKFVAGFIGSRRYHDGFLTLSPGISGSARVDGQGQTYKSVHDAISQGSDILIVGSDIKNSDNPGATAAKYQLEGYKAYLEVLLSRS